MSEHSAFALAAELRLEATTAPGKSGFHRFERQMRNGFMCKRESQPLTCAQTRFSMGFGSMKTHPAQLGNPVAFVLRTQRREDAHAKPRSDRLLHGG